MAWVFESVSLQHSQPELPETSTYLFPVLFRSVCCVQFQTRFTTSVSHGRVSKLSVSLSLLCIMFSIQHPYLIIISFTLCTGYSLLPGSIPSTAHIFCNAKSEPLAKFCCISLHRIHPKNKGTKFLRKVRKFLLNYTTSEPRSQY
jgi:hypothetical protein